MKNGIDARTMCEALLPPGEYRVGRMPSGYPMVLMNRDREILYRAWSWEGLMDCIKTERQMNYSDRPVHARCRECGRELCWEEVDDLGEYCSGCHSELAAIEYDIDVQRNKELADQS